MILCARRKIFEITTKPNRMKIPAPEIIIHRTVPKTTHSSKIQRRRTEMPALMRERQKKR